MSERADVVIVGAGPAGSRAAAVLAKAGARVVLLEKQRFPRPKTCGGGLVWRGRRNLPKDLALPVQSESCRARLRWDRATEGVVVQREFPIVSMTLRTELDQALAQYAVQAGAQLREASPLMSLERESSLWRVHSAHGVILAPVLIAADGASGVCARMAGWKDALATIPALETELVSERSPLGEALFDFAALSSGYAWCFEKRGLLSVGILSMQRGHQGLRAELQAWLKAQGLASLRIHEQAGYVIPVRPRPSLARNQCLLVGDAAGLVDPLTAEGISLALSSGEQAAKAALEPNPEGAYQRWLHAELLPELRAARLLAHLVYQRRQLASWVLRRGASSACEAMVAVVSGERGYRSFLRSPRAWARLITR